MDNTLVDVAMTVRLGVMVLGLWGIIRAFRTYLRRRSDPDSPEKRRRIAAWHILGCGTMLFLVSAVTMVLRHHWNGPPWLHTLAAVGLYSGAGIALVGAVLVGWFSVDTRDARGAV